MRATSYRIPFCLVFLLTANPISAEVIGGSILRSPPQFMPNSFYVGLRGYRQEAYPFQVIPGNGWFPERLEVPLYHYDGMEGGSAVFSIWSDISGLPDSQLATFPVSNITTEASIYSVTPSFMAGPLLGSTTYWLVGSNAGPGQVNWNMDQSIGNFVRAYRLDGGDWVLQSNLSRISAFVLLGSAVPEPSSIGLLGMAVVSLLTYSRQRRNVRKKV